MIFNLNIRKRTRLTPYPIKNHIFKTKMKYPKCMWNAIRKHKKLHNKG